MAATLRDIQAALQRKSGFEVLEHAEMPMKLRIGGRQPRDQMNMNSANWLLVVRQLNRRAKKAKWNVDISKHHVNRGEEPDDQVVFYWRILIQVTEGNVKDHYEEVVKVILSAPHTSRGEVTEFPLPGAGKDRNAAGGIMRGRGATGTK
jgi:hypothetical protein